MCTGLQQFEHLACSCTKCALASKAPTKSTLKAWPVPQAPLSRVHIDYAGPISGQNCLIAIDAYGKWPEVFLPDCTTAGATINPLRQFFSRFGCPETLVSDNGGQFTAATFTRFCKQSNLNQLCLPPYHSHSHGEVERFVDTFKRVLRKSKGEGTWE